MIKFTGIHRYVNGELISVVEEAPPYDPIEGQEKTFWELWPKKEKVFTVCYRTPNIGGEVHKIQLDLSHRSQIYTMPIPKYRRVSDSNEPSGYRLITNWESTADFANLSRDYAWLPKQDVLRSGLQTRELPTHWEESGTLGNPWDGCFVSIDSLRVPGSPDPDTEPTPNPIPVAEYPPYNPNYIANPSANPDYITPDDWKLWIPKSILVPHDGYEWVQINCDTKPRYAKLTVPQTIPLLIPGNNENPWVPKELWMPFSEEWQWVVWRWTQLDSPQRSHNYHLWAYERLFEDHKFATDLNDYDEHTNYVLSHFIDPIKFNLERNKPFKVKISLATGGNAIRGYKNGSQFIAEAFDIHNPPTNPDAAYLERWRCHQATQIGTIKLRDGTMKVVNFPMGRNALKSDGTWEKTRTSWPLIGVNGEVAIEMEKVQRLSNGSVYTTEQLERMQI